MSQDPVAAEHPLVVRSRAVSETGGTLVEVTSEQAGWDYVSFAVRRLPSGRRISDATADEEIGLVVLSGQINVRSSVGNWALLGGRDNVFAGNPTALYLPPGVTFEIDALSDCEIARCGAKAERGVAPYLIKPEDVSVELRGQGNAQRRVRHLLEVDRPAERLLLVEVITPSGNWSSYPPHKHDRDDPPHETYLEETYYHRFNPPQGFGFQRVYTPDRTLDAAIALEDGSLVMVPRGYHPAVAAPGYDLYYLNVMAGPTRRWKFRDDPDHAWVSASWQPYREK